MKRMKQSIFTILSLLLIALMNSISIFAGEEHEGLPRTGANAGLSAEILEMSCKVGVAILAIIVIVAILVVWFRKEKFTGGRLVKCTLAGISALLLVIIIVVNVITSIYAGSINAVFTKAGNNENISETKMEDWRQLVTDIADEGMVLMKNENDILPLEKETKINLLGYCAYNPIFSGSGSGSNVI